MNLTWNSFRLRRFRSAIALLSIIAFRGTLAADANPYFAITVVDEQTGRGVPLVELRTVSENRYYTDSNGVVAFLEPGLMGRDVFFHLSSHGYEFPADGFGFHGKSLKAEAGGSATLKIKRINVAERLYRITGEGIYRDSVLLGKSVPLEQPVLNAQVSGQDSIQPAEYRGKMFWFFGDTNKPAHPLGHYGTSGATTKTSADGLDPERGIDLHYFTDRDGFARKMVAIDEPGMKWIDGLVVVNDAQGQPKMLARCSRMKSLDVVHERSLILFDDKDESFHALMKLDANAPLYPQGHSVRYRSGDRDYVYFGDPYPLVRVKADFASVCDLHAYEGFTCLERGSRFAKGSSKVERGVDGKVVWGWKVDTSPVSVKEEKELVDAGKIKAPEKWYALADSATGKAVTAATGTIQYNAWRKRWVMILCEFGGTSMVGEIWYSEAEKPEGPWLKAAKIVTHDRYSFYNVVHHPEFDREGGRVIYFEGTYTAMFSGNPLPTPRYEYNQIMYRLDLSDPRLKLP